jgi:mono/diheme cytochrome c family protein
MASHAERLVAVLAALLIGMSGAASAADVANGRRIAEQVCAQCHVVTSEQKRGSDQVPSFEAIAQRGLSDNALAAFLADPHPRMPDLALSRAEIADILAYMKTRAK